MTTPTGRYFQLLTRKPLTPARAGRAIAVSTLLVTVACGAVMRVVDSSEFNSVWLGLWWAVQTVTTVGYGDIVPQTSAGRFAGVAIMFTGIAILGVLAGSLAALFHLEEPEPDAEEPTGEAPTGGPTIHAELVALQVQMQALQARLGALAARTRSAPGDPDES